MSTITATKSSGALQASASNAAAATTTSSSLDLTTSPDGCAITAKITNGGTGPTIACTATVNISPDNSTWYYDQAGTAGTTASGIYAFRFEVSKHAKYVEIVFSGNTAQAVTVEAQYEKIDSYSVV